MSGPFVVLIFLTFISHSVLGNEVLNNSISNSAVEVKVQDAYGCEVNQTECPGGNGSSACCPFVNAQCCQDQINCCPQNTVCDSGHCVVTTKVKIMEVTPMTSVIGSNSVGNCASPAAAHENEVIKDSKLSPSPKLKKPKSKLALKLRKSKKNDYWTNNGNSSLTNVSVGGPGCEWYSCLPCVWCTCCIATSVEALCCPVPAGVCCEGHLTCCLPGFHCCDDQIHCCPSGHECKKDSHGRFDGCA